MATITLKNVPDGLYASLKKRAADNRRSINNEAIVRLEQTLDRAPRDPKRVLKEIRAFRRTLKGIQITDRFLDVAKRQGRL